MRSLFRSNKSQSSIDRFSPSREGSPIHPEAPATAYPPPAQTAPLTQRYPRGQSQYEGASDSPEQRSYSEFDQAQTHPAHQLTRSQSHRTGAGPDAAYKSPGRPSVHITGPSSLNTGPSIYEEQRFPPPPVNQVQPVAPEKERRKSKRSIFGLHKDPKENTSPTSGRGPGRAGSLLRKAQPGQQGQQSVTISGPYPQAQPGNQVYQERGQDAFYQSQDSFTDSEDRTPNERYYQQGQGQFDQPQSHPSVNSENQLRGDPRYSQQYQGDRERPSEESAEIYLAYEQQRQQEQRAGEEQDTSAFDPRSIRPPSQLSLLGPPSPGTQSADSRPSSATNVSNQSRFSVQSATALGPLSQQQHIAMARGDPPPNGLKDQMSQQRDPRLQEPGHTQYTGPPDPRSRVSQHAEQGRSTPPPRSREDIGNMDFQTLLQRHEELRESSFNIAADND